MNPPDVAYARSGDIAIAYQVVGSGPVDIVFTRGITGDLLSTWDQPLLVRHVEGLAASGRVLMLDKRGTGLSDRVREVQSLETSMDDIRAVMDAATGRYFDVQPTGRRLVVHEMMFNRVRDGRVATTWAMTAGPGFYEQLTGRQAPEAVDNLG